jgi:energy-coupling factor transporter ATP-binding protein EcfA2
MSNPSSPDTVDALAAALEKRFGLVRCNHVIALRNRTAAQPAAFVTGLRMRIGEYYDIQPAITVYDAGLGTLGLVERISHTDPESSWLRAIERAAAVRQILIDAAEPKTPNQSNRELALQVELVLVISGPAGSGAPDSLRTALMRIARETGYLRLAGLSILEASLHPDLPDAVLRRAFAWMLKDTRKWFQRDVFRQSPSDDGKFWRKDGESLSLRLTDYRLAGIREFDCQGGSWLNLVHGHNGSGKSSLAEALELLLTNRIQRLEEGGEANYFRVVRHRGHDASETSIDKASAAVVSLLDATQLDATQRVRAQVQIENGRLVRVGGTPDKALETNSFRIDQVFMDKLARSLPAGRAAIFLTAFSPGETGQLKEMQELRRQVTEGWKSLPDHVRKRAEAETAPATSLATPRTLTEEEIVAFVDRELGPLTDQPGSQDAPSPTNASSAELARTSVEALLPVSSADMALLGRLHPSLAQSTEALLNVRDRAALAQASSQFQSYLTSLVGSLTVLLSDLNAAQLVFRQFQGWVAVGRTHRGQSFEADLRQWLDLQAISDLISRYGDIASTVQAAKTGDWKPESADAFLLSMAWDGGTRNLALVEQLNEARARVESWQERTTEPVSSAASDSVKVRRWLSPREVEALNQVGSYLPSAGCSDLGIRFNRALARDHEETFTDMVIGRKGGLDQAIREVAELIGACERLQVSAAGRPGEIDILARTTSLVQAARQLIVRSKKLTESFFQRLATDKQERAELLAAFNELLALMTPARWAYRDIEITPDLASGDPALGLTTAGGARADLLFNTAELNAFAMVLFLLLAPRLPNALRLLILDDPLQNMDELTVVTLSRAIAKLRPPVYPGGWQILALFHGERNVEVIRDETPCVVYQLPWLQSAMGPKTLEAPTPVGDTHNATWQKLSAEILDASDR